MKTLEVSPYFTQFSRMLTILSDGQELRLKTEFIKEIETYLKAMEVEAETNPFLRDQLANVQFYRSSIYALVLNNDSWKTKWDLILSLYKEKLQVWTFYVEMKRKDS